MKRTVSIVLAATLLLSVLTGCSVLTSVGRGVVKSINASPTPSAQTSPSASSAASVNTSLYPADTVILNVDGEPVRWSEFLYWTVSNANAYIDTKTADWSQIVSDNMTMEQYIIELGVEAVALYHSVMKKATERGITLSDSDRTEIDSTIQSGIDYFGSQEAFDQYLSQNYLNEDLYRYMLQVSDLYFYLFSSAYGENAENYSNADTAAFAEENGYMQVKHILLSTGDDEKANADAYARIGDLLAQLKAADSSQLESLFDQLMNQYSQDTGLADNPNGYLFTEGTMTDEFEKSALSLGIDSLSDIVTTDYGYHIILRIPVNPDCVPVGDDSGYTLRYYAASSEFDGIAKGWADAVNIEYTDAFKNLSLSKLFS